MKIARLIVTAGLIAGTLGIAGAADAQYYRHGYHGRHHVCHTEWRHHHRVRVCR